MEFSGKVALVTGAAQGIGKAVSEALLRKGSKVCVTDVNVEKGESIVKEFRKLYGEENAMFFKCDVSSINEFKAAILKTREVFGDINVLVNNAGVGVGEIVNINLNGVINGCSLAYEIMGKHNNGNGGIIINVSSIVALVPFPFCPVYAATKAGIMALTRSYGHPLHYQKTGIVFAAVCPCAIDTELFWLTTEDSIFAEEHAMVRSQLEVIPPSAVADAVVQIIKDKRNGGIMTVIGGKENEYVTLPGEDMLI